MKKTISIVLTLAITVSALFCMTACENTEKTATGDEKTLSYWVALPSGISTHVQSFNEVSMYQKREADSGVHIEFIHPTAAEQFNLMLASGDLPDIIEYTWTNYNGGPQKALDENIILPLNEYEKYMPNYMKAMTEGEYADIYDKGTKTDSGVRFGFAPLNVGDYRIFSGPWIRKDLLDNLGLAVPETIDEWTTALRALKDSGIKTPLTGMIANTLSTSSSAFPGAFGVQNNWYIDEGEVKYGPLEDGYIEYLEMLNLWYKEGLIDRDIATNQRKLVDSKIMNGDSAALIYGGIGGYIGTYYATKAEEDPTWNLVAAPFPVKNKGQINEFAISQLDVSNISVAAVTKSCKNPELAIEWLDYWYSEEGNELANFGIEGEHYNKVDGKYIYTDKILNAPGLSISEAIALSSRGNAPAPGFKQMPDYLEQYYQYPQQKDAFAKWTPLAEHARKHLLPNVLPTSEENDIVTSIKADMDTFVAEKLWNFVTGAESLDNYDSFKKELKSRFSIDKYQKIMQAQYERYLKR